jgi:hypothetical protein
VHALQLEQVAVVAVEGCPLLGRTLAEEIAVLDLDEAVAERGLVEDEHGGRP